MIIFLNGPFGVGKTTAAKLVADDLQRGWLFDPEIVGEVLTFLLRPWRSVEDFQDYELWPVLTVWIALLSSRCLRREVVIPMTISNRSRWSYIRSAFEKHEPQLYLFRLTCSEETLRQRILGRPDAEGNHKWCLDHIASGLEIMSDPEFGLAVNSEGNLPYEVALQILQTVRNR